MKQTYLAPRRIYSAQNIIGVFRAVTRERRRRDEVIAVFACEPHIAGHRAQHRHDIPGKQTNNNNNNNNNNNSKKNSEEESVPYQLVVGGSAKEDLATDSNKTKETNKTNKHVNYMHTHIYTHVHRSI